MHDNTVVQFMGAIAKSAGLNVKSSIVGRGTTRTSSKKLVIRLN